MGKYKLLIFVSGAVILLDQATKALIMHYFRLYETVTVIPGFFNLTHVYNPGGAFGFMAHQSQSIRVILFFVVSILAAVFILYFYHRTPKDYPVLAAGFALIFGGAVGNLIDRIRFGKVLDFLDVYVHNLHWPAFNVADSGISIGMGIFLFYVLFRKLPM